MGSFFCVNSSKNGNTFLFFDCFQYNVSMTTRVNVAKEMFLVGMGVGVPNADLPSLTQ